MRRPRLASLSVTLGWLGVTTALATFAHPVRAQPAGQTPTSPVPRTAEEPPPQEPSGPAEARETPATAVARDELLLDAALEAVAVGDLPRAHQLFVRLAFEANRPETRATAAVLAERVRALQARRAAGLIPGLSPPALAGPRPARRALPPPPETGRPAFLLTTTGLGLGLWGWTLPLALGLGDEAGNDNTRAVVGLYMITAASSFVVPLLLTRKHPPSWGQMNLAFYGGTRGIELGLVVSNVLFGSQGGSFGNGADQQAVSASYLLGSVGGLVGGYLWAGATDMTAGQARTLVVLGDYGLFAGFATGHVLKLDEATVGGQFADFDARARGMGAAGGVGALLGIAGGRWLSLYRDNSWGDGEVMRASGLFGVLGGATAVLMYDPDAGSRPAVAGMAVGAGLGLVAGDFLVRDTSFTVGQSLLVDLSLLAGGLGAAGLMYLTFEPDDSRPYFVAATAGAGGLAGLTYWALRDSGGQGRADRGDRPHVALSPRLEPDGLRGLTLLGSF